MPETPAKSLKIRRRRQATPTLDPAVIVDVLFEDGSLFITIQNISDRPAYRVSVKFDHPVYGEEGRKNLATLPIFRRIEYLAPFKILRVFLDTSESFFRSKQPTRISGQLTYINADRKLFVSPIIHDLKIYKDLTYRVTPSR